MRSKQIRPPSERTYLAGLAEVLVESHPRRIERVYLSERAAEEFKGLQPHEEKPKVGDIIEVCGIKDLDSLLHTLWPSLAEKRK